MKNIAIFASGNGTNAEAIIRHFENNQDISVRLILSNKADAYVLERAKKHHISSHVFTRNEFYNETAVIEILKDNQIDLIVLAGFLWLVPASLVKEYPGRIVNIHPALLPKYGGKGMYGSRVHQAVKESGDKETGITIHLVNENYDEGDILFQATCQVDKDDTPEDIAASVHELEYQYYPVIIESMFKNK
ncbi:phosphoribosylglycinamide formyltransferase [Fulvivirga sedimenti]|jgi:phosphoribosylglycinamide formyltransferase-1|uniref:Phosphoribosylglycinamide formyltransferase n=1 Tax=Fulvivirga sedimenti TaxID=2879465 RepID=A0A9X1KW04_9BACT|nr:phosphoribosylglycinamide formyltransferase [Fulvivirga sedimenti]MCA6074225.1 phosphoribosylglycinamide formyltransferase [Fulvivirga sedimenti]